MVLGDTDECAQGAMVSLTGNGGNMTSETDFFGDFEFEKLEKNRDYVIKIEVKGYQPQERKVKTETDIYLVFIRI